MTLPQFHIIRPNADDPGPRFMRSISDEQLRRIFTTHRPVYDDRPDLYALLGARGGKRGSPAYRPVSRMVLSALLTLAIVYVLLTAALVLS